VARARNPLCGVCGQTKIEKRGRLICPECARRYAREAYRKGGPKLSTEKVKERKKRWANTRTSSGLTNSCIVKLKGRYGISPEEYLGLLNRQNYLCAICKNNIRERPYIDHDHSTGKVRGALCFNCNTALGHFKDDLNILRAAVSYAEEATRNGGG
jgi:uncharacterized Zn finger protein (UPF0148 family)